MFDDEVCYCTLFPEQYAECRCSTLSSLSSSPRAAGVLLIVLHSGSNSFNLQDLWFSGLLILSVLEDIGRKNPEDCASCDGYYVPHICHWTPLSSPQAFGGLKKKGLDKLSCNGSIDPKIYHKNAVRSHMQHRCRRCQSLGYDNVDRDGRFGKDCQTVKPIVCCL